MPEGFGANSKIWRILHTLHRLHEKHSLTIGLPEIAMNYQLRTHGGSRFVPQLRPRKTPFIYRATQDNHNFRSNFFFVDKSTIPGGMELPMKWIKKAPRFEDLVIPRSDSEKRIEALLGLPASERTFSLDLTESSTEHSEASMSIAPKFEDLVSSRSNSDKRIEALLELLVTERTFKLEAGEGDTKRSQSNMSSGIPESKKQFALSDLGDYLSSSTIVKKEKSVMVPAKSHVPLVRAKTPKKRKAFDNLDLEIFDGLSSFEAIRKLQAIANLDLDKFFADLEAAEGKAEEALLMVEDHKKIAQAKSKTLERECQKTAAL